MAQTPQTFAGPNPLGVFGVTPIGVVTLVANVKQDIYSLLTSNLRGLQGDIQSVWVDNSAGLGTVVVRAQQSRQYAIWGPGQFGWQQLLITMPSTVEIISTANVSVAINVASGVINAALSTLGTITAPNGSTRVDITSSLAAQTFLAANTARRGFTVWNESTETLYLLLATGTVSATNYTVILGPNDYFESPFPYGGVVSGVWAVVNGGARITEF